MTCKEWKGGEKIDWCPNRIGKRDRYRDKFCERKGVNGMSKKKKIGRRRGKENWEKDSDKWDKKKQKQKKKARNRKESANARKRKWERKIKRRKERKRKVRTRGKKQ